MTSSKGASLVSQQNFYHQRVGHNPTVLGNGTYGFVRHLQSNDPSTIVDGVTIDHSWYAIPTSRKTGLIVVRNCEGQFYELQPTEEQVRETQERVLEVSFHDSDRPAIEVPPGEQIDLTPASGTAVKIRARSGTVLATIMVVPR